MYVDPHHCKIDNKKKRHPYLLDGELDASGPDRVLDCVRVHLVEKLEVDLIGLLVGPAHPLEVEIILVHLNNSSTLDHCTCSSL